MGPGIDVWPRELVACARLPLNLLRQNERKLYNLVQADILGFRPPSVLAARVAPVDTVRASRWGAKKGIGQIPEKGETECKNKRGPNLVLGSGLSGRKR